MFQFAEYNARTSLFSIWVLNLNDQVWAGNPNRQAPITNKNKDLVIVDWDLVISKLNYQKQRGAGCGGIPPHGFPHSDISGW